MKRLLIQTQLSNYSATGKWILECDSGWQMVMGRVREMLKINPNLHIDVMGPPLDENIVTLPQKVNPDLPWSTQENPNRLRYRQHPIVPNALATRYNFDISTVSTKLGLTLHKHDKTLRYDAVYINDPMHLRNFKAMFLIAADYQPKFYVHSHFVDVPSCPKFPKDASLWMGQCEAAVKADWNFWQCRSALNQFEIESRDLYRNDVIDTIMAKSSPWDDGYSIEEINTQPDRKNVRFDPDVLQKMKNEGKTIIFVPNRIGGRGRSSDYTNCGKFMFEILPQLRKVRQDFVVLAGNPSQKFFNHELKEECGPNGYVSLVPDSFTRDEFKIVASMSDISVGLYDQDTYGGTVARECVELGCLPLWLACNEYESLARSADYNYLCKVDFSDIINVASDLIDSSKRFGTSTSGFEELRGIVRERCSYEETTADAMKIMNIYQ